MMRKKNKDRQARVHGERSGVRDSKGAPTEELEPQRRLRRLPFAAKERGKDNGAGRTRRSDGRAVDVSKGPQLNRGSRPAA
jgi:hypothetical protein